MSSLTPCGEHSLVQGKLWHDAQWLINPKKFICEEFLPLPSLQSYWDPVQQNNNFFESRDSNLQ